MKRANQVNPFWYTGLRCPQIQPLYTHSVQIEMCWENCGLRNFIWQEDYYSLFFSSLIFILSHNIIQTSIQSFMEGLFFPPLWPHSVLCSWLHVQQWLTTMYEPFIPAYLTKSPCCTETEQTCLPMSQPVGWPPCTCYSVTPLCSPVASCSPCRGLCSLYPHSSV